METRVLKVSAGNPGGNASKGAMRYRLQVPTSWMRAMGVTAEDRELKLEFDGEKIILKKA